MRQSTAHEHDPPRLRLTAVERRRTILCAARAEFARVGYYGASTASIARMARCSEPMLYKHFAGKLDLFITAMQDAIERAHVTCSDAERTTDNVLDQLRVFLDPSHAGDCYLELMRLRRHAATVDIDDVRLLILRLEQQSAERITAVVHLGIEQGAFRPDIHPPYVVACWTGLMHAACHHDALEPGTFHEQALHAEVFLQSLC